MGNGIKKVALLDRTVAILVLGLYITGSAALLIKGLRSSPDHRRRLFSSGELALLPDRWRRWLLNEKPPAASEAQPH